jgi:hypothetical protein
MSISAKCHFCDSNLEDINHAVGWELIHCPNCGKIELTSEAVKFIHDKLTIREKAILSIVFLYDFENRRNIYRNKPFLVDDLKKIIKEYHPLDPIEKMDIALEHIGKKLEHLDTKYRCFPKISTYFIVLMIGI